MTLLPSLAENTPCVANVGEASTLYGVAAVSVETRVARVAMVAVVDVDELVSFRTGGEALSGWRTWCSGVVFPARWWPWCSGLADRCCTGRGSSLLMGGASDKLGAGCILCSALTYKQMRRNPMIDGNPAANQFHPCVSAMLNKIRPRSMHPRHPMPKICPACACQQRLRGITGRRRKWGSGVSGGGGREQAMPR